MQIDGPAIMDLGLEVDDGMIMRTICATWGVIGFWANGWVKQILFLNYLGTYEHDVMLGCKRR